MNAPTTEFADYAAISKTVQHYIDGAKSGRGDDMKPAFHSGATIFGYVDKELVAGPIQMLFDWTDKDGPARDLAARTVSVDVVGSIATVRLEADNWSGHRYTDMFTLLKVDGA